MPPVNWHAPHEPWIKVRLATSVEPLNFVFVSQIDGFDLGRRRWRREETNLMANCRNPALRQTLGILPRYLITRRGGTLSVNGPPAASVLTSTCLFCRPQPFYSAVAHIKSGKITTVCRGGPPATPAPGPSHLPGSRRDLIRIQLTIQSAKHASPGGPSRTPPTPDRPHRTNRAERLHDNGTVGYVRNSSAVVPLPSERTLVRLWIFGKHISG